MRRAVGALFVGVLTTAALAESKPNTLTAREVSEGWILLFDGETSFGWKIDGDAKVAGGEMVIGADRPTVVETTTAFGFFELQFDYRLVSGGGVRFVVEDAGFDLPVADEAAPEKNAETWLRATWKAEPKGKGVSVSTSVALAVDGTAIGAFEPLTLESVHSTPVRFSVMPFAQAAVRNVKLRPLALGPLFNGKDLTGWKEIPGKASRFTVTPRGELNVKNGNGELQTVGQWADFVLQIDVISNGDHLNSGVFFRCLPGQFWQGYEMQVRNQWEGDDRTKPVDYGTGGLYNRQPTRRVVSNDREWFTATIAAQGKHIATWVNGYPCTDYVDNKPPAPTARKGSFLGKGCVSLQGHDPTTDLSFRNIRLGELPPPQAPPASAPAKK